MSRRLYSTLSACNKKMYSFTCFIIILATSLTVSDGHQFSPYAHIATHSILCMGQSPLCNRNIQRKQTEISTDRIKKGTEDLMQINTSHERKQKPHRSTEWDSLNHKYHLSGGYVVWNATVAHKNHIINSINYCFILQVKQKNVLLYSRAIN